MSELSPSPGLPLAPSLLSEACERFARLQSAEQQVGAAHQEYYDQLWFFGQSLLALREEPAAKRHWSLFLEATFPALGRSRDPDKVQTLEQLNKSRLNRALDATNFYEANPDAWLALPGADSPVRGKYSAESIRTCVFHMAPEKPRELLPGDGPVPRADTPLTFVNQVVAWNNRCLNGLATRPPVEQLRADLKPVVTILLDLLGREYIESLLA